MTFKELVEDGKRPQLPPSVRPSYSQAKRFDPAVAGAEQLGWDYAPGAD